MADRNKPHRPYIAFRLRFIDEADRSLVSAKALVARAEVEPASQPLWSEAGENFEQAAKLYRRASLGLMARHAYEQASRCFAQASVADAARRCNESALVIPAYWEASPDE